MEETNRSRNKMRKVTLFLCQCHSWPVLYFILSKQASHQTEVVPRLAWYIPPENAHKTKGAIHRELREGRTKEGAATPVIDVRGSRSFLSLYRLVVGVAGVFYNPRVTPLTMFLIACLGEIHKASKSLLLFLGLTPGVVFRGIYSSVKQLLSSTSHYCADISTAKSKIFYRRGSAYSN